MDSLGWTGCQQGERTQLYTHANEPLPLSSWCFRLSRCEGRRGCPTAMEPSSSRLMCPWSFVKAGYLLLQSNCSSLGAAERRTHCHEKSGVSCYEALSTTKGPFSPKHWGQCFYKKEIWFWFCTLLHKRKHWKQQVIANRQQRSQQQLATNYLGSIRWNHISMWSTWVVRR